MVINSSATILFAIFLPCPLVVTITTHITKTHPHMARSIPCPKARARLAEPRLFLLIVLGLVAFVSFVLEPGG